MGQAKLRGTQEQRVAMATSKTQPPKPGLYVSTREVPGMRFIVEDVSVVEEEDGDGFFLVSLIDEVNADNMSAEGDELDPEAWFSLVKQYGLEFCGSR